MYLFLWCFIYGLKLLKIVTNWYTWEWVKFFSLGFKNLAQRAAKYTAGILTLPIPIPDKLEKNNIYFHTVLWCLSFYSNTNLWNACAERVKFNCFMINIATSFNSTLASLKKYTCCSIHLDYHDISCNVANIVMNILRP